MNKETREVLDFKVDMSVYESVDEADRAAGTTGAGLKEMNNNLLYRGTYQEARNIITEVVERVTGVKPLSRPTGEKDEKTGEELLEVYEKDAVFVARALAESGKTVADLQPHITKACNAANDNTGLAADIRARARTGKPPTLAKKYSTNAAEILNSGKLDEVNAKFLHKFASSTFTVTGDLDKDVVALGWLLREAELAYLAQSSPLAKLGIGQKA